MNFKISNLFNLFFRLILIFFIVFVWMRYLFESLVLSLIISALITLFIDFSIQFFLNKKKYLKNIKKEELIKIETIINTFILSENNENLNFFLNLAQKKHKAIKKNNFILIENENKCNVALFPYFTFRKFTIDDLVFILNKTKKHNVEKLVICASDFDNDCKNLAKKLDVKIILLNGQETYFNLLKLYDIYPEKLIKIKPESTQKLKDLFTNSLSRKKTKAYFFSSVIMLLSSFIIPFNIYYLIVASILLILAFISFIRPFIRKPLPENIL